MEEENIKRKHWKFLTIKIKLKRKLKRKRDGIIRRCCWNNNDKSNLHIFILCENMNFIFKLLAVLKCNGVEHKCFTQPWYGSFSLGDIESFTTMTIFIHVINRTDQFMWLDVETYCEIVWKRRHKWFLQHENRKGYESFGKDQQNSPYYNCFEVLQCSGI